MDRAFFVAVLRPTLCLLAVTMSASDSASTAKPRHPRTTVASDRRAQVRTACLLWSADGWAVGGDCRPHSPRVGIRRATGCPEAVPAAARSVPPGSKRRRIHFVRAHRRCCPARRRECPSLEAGSRGIGSPVAVRVRRLGDDHARTTVRMDHRSSRHGSPRVVLHLEVSAIQERGRWIGSRNQA